ncbi:MAG: hypothetical protein QMD03_05765 [Syntrophales bacterium]|nr:hypothetical protein [Syntrophales bacterium]
MDSRTLVAKVLEREGCLVEGRDSHLKVLFPEVLQKMLSVGEMGTLVFQGKGVGQDHLLQGSEILDSLKPLISAKGLLAAVSFPHLKPNPKNIEALLTNNLAVQNGIFRFVSCEIKQCSYLLMNFLVSAVSDTKAERILTVVLNGQADTVALGMGEKLKDKWEDASYDLPASEIPDISRTLKKGKAVAGKLSLVQFQDFLKSLNRRLNRDLKRLQEYYTTIAGEIEKNIMKKGCGEEDVKLGLSRLEATRIECHRKIRDVCDRYAVEITIEPINALHIFVHAAVAQVYLQRRKNRKLREIPLNPISDNLEYLLCSNCYQPILNFYLCDEIHPLCASCWPACSLCKKT